MGKIDRDPVESSPGHRGREDGRVEEYFRWDPLDDPRFAPLIVGRGNIGGKGRSLLFAMAKIWDSGEETLKRVIFPRSLFIAADSFDEVLSQIPDLERLKAGDPGELEAAFLKAELPERVSLAVREFLEEVTDPIIVRSSSVLEDSLKYSFAGKYLSTFEFNDGGHSIEERCKKVEEDIKKIYARTFFPVALAYRKKHGMGTTGWGSFS